MIKIEEYEWLIGKLLKKYYSTELTREDLMQEGRIGLMQAREKFDETRGIKFSTYAYNFVRTRLSRATAKARPGGIQSGIKYYEQNNTNLDGDRRIHGLRTSLSNVDKELSSHIDINKLNNEIFVKNIFKLLENEEVELLKKYYGIGCEPRIMSDIAKDYGCVKSTIQARIQVILAKLSKKMVDKKYDKEYVDYK